MVQNSLSATSFPVEFTMKNIETVNSTVSAIIMDRDKKVTFITDEPVHVSALNGETAEVTIKIE